MNTLQERFEKWAIENNKPYDRMTSWAACEAAFYAAYRMALEDAERDCTIDRSGPDCAQRIRARREGLE